MAIKKSTNILGDTGGGGSSGDVKSVNHIQPGPDGDITVPMFGLGLAVSPGRGFTPTNSSLPWLNLRR